MNKVLHQSFVASCQRNGPHIFAALKERLPASATVLEIGSGSGQHAVMFARALPTINWQPSDLPDTHAGISSRINEAALTNLKQPLALDVCNRHNWPSQQFDLIYSANTLHIMSKMAVAALFANTPSVMRPGASMFIYGPFKDNGQHNSEGNIAFDARLRATDPTRGIRDICWLKQLASDAGINFVEDIPMPNNNRILVWQRIYSV
ncbi:MAG: DUF938 domain-containing protein [Mariprofundus sp.]|nr:DUF938 domain-containing protein [Mariprofundus sp.]